MILRFGSQVALVLVPPPAGMRITPDARPTGSPISSRPCATLPHRVAAAGVQPLHFSFGSIWASWRHFHCRLAGSGKPVDPGLGLKEKPCPSREGPRAGEPRL